MSGADGANDRADMDEAMERVTDREPIGPRERAISDGVGALGDADLIAVLLGTGLAGRPVTLVAAGVLERVGGLEGLGRVGASALADHPGVGRVKALRIAVALELGRRWYARSTRPRPPLRTAQSVAEHMAPMIAGLDHEEMWVLSLDGRNGIRGARRVAQGGLHGCSVSARDILRAAVADAASAFVLVHNHPSGDPTPSSEDVEMTKRVEIAAEILGTPLLDHVVIGGDDRWTSLLDGGFMNG